MLVKRISVLVSIALILNFMPLSIQAKAIKKVIQGEIADGTSLSNIGSFSFENNSSAGRTIFKTCKVGDICEISAEVEDDHVQRVFSAKIVSEISTSPKPYFGGWTESEKGCEHPLSSKNLDSGEYIFSEDARINFEGKCKITHAMQSGPFSWDLDESCKAPDRSSSFSKDRWSISVSGNTMIASITKIGSKPGEAFTLRRCEAEKER